MHTYTYGFEGLDAYKLARTIAREVRRTSLPGHLEDQATRAADSVALNIAEGHGRGMKTKAGKNHFRIARGSAGETFAVLDLADQRPDLRAKLQRLGVILNGMVR